MRLDRLLAIVVKLLNQDRISSHTLAEEFELSIRTIYRDIEAINQAGIPIIAYPGNNGGFGIVENYKIDHQVFTLQDMVSVLSVLKGFQQTFADKRVKGAAEKIQSLVPKDKAAEVQAQVDQVVIDILPWGTSPKQKQFLIQLRQAIAGNRLIQFQYRNTKNEFALRSVEPMTLLLKGYAWYLFAYCLTKKDFRIFRLSRMQKLKIMEKRFIRKAQSYEPSMLAETANMKMIKLVLRCSPRIRYWVDDHFEKDQVKQLKDNSCQVTLSLPEDEWLYGFLLSFGGEVEVLAPARLRPVLRDKAEKIMYQYNPDTGLSQAKGRITSTLQARARRTGTRRKGV